MNKYLLVFSTVLYICIINSTDGGENLQKTHTRNNKKGKTNAIALTIVINLKKL